MERMQSFHSHPLGAVGWVARAVQLLSAIIVLGITAWAARDTKTVTVIFTLVIVCFSGYRHFHSLTSSGCPHSSFCRLLDSYKLHGKTLQMACLGLDVH